MWREISDGSPGNDVGNNIQVGRTSVGTEEVNASTGLIDDRIGGMCVTNVILLQEYMFKISRIFPRKCFH